MIYEEALAESKKLKEIAEQNAKNAIIEAVTPKIKKIIEDQLLEGTDDGKNDNDEILLQVDDAEENEKKEEVYEDIENKDEFILNNESVEILSSILKEENIADKIELSSLRIYNTLQKAIIQENKNSVLNICRSKNQLKELLQDLKENKNNIKEETFKRLSENIVFMEKTAIKFINHIPSKKINELNLKIKQVKQSKKLEETKKNAYANKIFKEAKLICDQINENKIVLNPKNHKQTSKKLEEISKIYKEIINDKKKTIK